jgi:hypothetical protein
MNFSVKLRALRFSVVVITLVSFFPFSSRSQDSYAYRQGRIKHRLSAGVVKSYYINHPQHTDHTMGELGYSASYKAEYFIRGRANVMLGADFLNFGLTFRGYYKKPGYTYLFDGTFPYTHEIRINEAELPLTVKVTFNHEKEKTNSPYFVGGVGARYIISSYTVITNDSTGITLYDGKDNIDFETHRLMKGMSSFYEIGFGFQHNYRNTARAIFFEVNYKYGISRLHYDGNDGSNDLNIKDDHLSFLVGIRL